MLGAASYLLGPSSVPPRGVLQTAAVTRAGEIIRVGAHAPKSAWDFFALHLARASADAIVTTGKILRDEPTLRYDLEGAGTLPEALHAYRAEVAQRMPRAKVYVLSSGRDLDLAHPALRGWAEPVLALPTDAPSDIEARARGVGIAVRRFDALSLRGLVEALAREHACVSIEAGPSSSRALYDAPSRVDTLWLSRFEDVVDERARGERFVDDVTRARALGEARHVVTLDEPSGAWTFSRYAR